MTRFHNDAAKEAVIKALKDQNLDGVCQTVLPTIEESIDKRITIYEHRNGPFLHRLISAYVLDLAREIGIKAEFLVDQKREAASVYLESHPFVQSFREKRMQEGIELYQATKDAGVSKRFNSKAWQHQTIPIAEIETTGEKFYLFQITFEETGFEEGLSRADMIMMSPEATARDYYPMRLSGAFPSKNTKAMVFHNTNQKEKLYSESGFQHQRLLALLNTLKPEL